MKDFIRFQLGMGAGLLVAATYFLTTDKLVENPSYGLAIPGIILAIAAGFGVYCWLSKYQV